MIDQSTIKDLGRVNPELDPTFKKLQDPVPITKKNTDPDPTFKKKFGSGSESDPREAPGPATPDKSYSSALPCKRDKKDKCWLVKRKLLLKIEPFPVFLRFSSHPDGEWNNGY